MTNTQAARLERSSAKIFGALSCSNVKIFDGMVRNAAAAPRLWLKALTRKRDSPQSRRKSHTLKFLIMLALAVAHDVVHHGVHLFVLQRRDVLAVAHRH